MTTKKTYRGKRLSEPEMRKFFTDCGNWFSYQIFKEGYGCILAGDPAGLTECTRRDHQAEMAAWRAGTPRPGLPPLFIDPLDDGEKDFDMELIKGILDSAGLPHLKDDRRIVDWVESQLKRGEEPGMIAAILCRAMKRKGEST